MGLFDNIIGNGAEEVEPLSIEIISDASSNPGSGGSTTGGTQDDSVNPIIIPGDVSPIITDEIPEIDIGGDMDFSLFGGSPTEGVAQSPIITMVDNPSTTPLINDVITENILTDSGENNVEMLQASNDSVIISSPVSMPIAITTIGSSQASNTPISIGESPVIISNPDTLNTDMNSVIISQSNDGLMGLLGNTDSTGKVDTPPAVDITSSDPTVSQVNNTTSSIDNGLSNLIREDNSAPSENPIANIIEINNTNNTSDSVAIGLPENVIPPQIGNLGEITHSSIGHESLAEKISGFLKELQELKENDDALLKEKIVEIARLEAEKRELEMIQADRERLNKTIDLLSNIKNI